MKNKLVSQIEAARLRIRPYARKTELSFSPDLSAELGARIYFKWENHHPTLADAVAGGLEEGAVTFDLVKKYVDRVITVEEDAIYQAIRLMFKYHQEKVEGAGALALAGLISYPEIFSGKKVVAVTSGGNIEEALWKKIIYS